MKSLAKPHPRTTLIWSQCALEAISCGKCHGSVPVISRPLSRCFPLSYRAPRLGLVCADVISRAQWTIGVPSLHLLTLCSEDARKGRWAGGDHAHPQVLLLPGPHRGSVGGKIPVPLGFLLSTPLLDMKQKATDRLMRDPILLCNWTKWFVVLQHTMNNHRPVGRWNAICRAFWLWPPFATHRRRTGVRGFILSEHLLNLEIQVTRRDKEEIKNW
jgi:hypothetical protein